MRFSERLSLGAKGEDIIYNYLKSEGWVVYRAPTDISHPFDFLCHKNGKTIIAEVKTKARMKQFRATGIDYRHYKIYKSFETKCQVPSKNTPLRRPKLHHPCYP